MRKTQNNIMAYLGAHVCTSKSQNVYFDIDTVEVVLDTGLSVSLSSEQSYFITYKTSTGLVNGLGLHNIIGIRTVKFTVINNHGKKVNLFKFVTQFTYRLRRMFRLFKNNVG